MERIHIFISGNVQGIFLRARTKSLADKLGLKGFIKNLDDGRVEAIFEGPEEKIKSIIDFIKKLSLVRIDKLNTKKKIYKGEFDSFEIEY
ncbi:MAG: acylphosphatase [Nanoarchaeota archaeon]